MEEKKFVGLEGLKYFWTKIETKVVKIIEDEIAQIIANAPEDLDTLKEIADWISSHANDAAAMNTAISTNTSDIATLKTSVAGKSDTGHTHTKSEITDFPTSLPANGGTADKATSVVDYGDTSKTIQIGYAGAGATVDNLSHIAGYLTGGTQIKDVSKSVLQAWLGLSNYLPLSGGTVTGATQFNNYVKLNAWDGCGTGTANLWYDGNNKFVEIQNATDLKLSGVNVSKEGHTHTKSQITDFPTSLPANGGTASSCSGNSATATQLQTARTINIQDSSATYTGTGASFNGSGDATIKLPSTIKANEFKIGDKQQSIAYRSKSYNGYKMHEVQTNALYIEGRELDTGDSGGLAITNDSVTVFGAGDTNGVFRVVNEDKAGDGSETAPAIFNIFKDGKVTMTNRLTAPSATIGSRPVITGTYSASDGILNLYTN